MENIKTISDLTFSLSINDNQELEINNSGVSEKITIGQLKTHIASNKADVDGSNVTFSNLSNTAKENLNNKIDCIDFTSAIARTWNTEYTTTNAVYIQVGVSISIGTPVFLDIQGVSIPILMEGAVGSRPNQFFKIPSNTTWKVRGGEGDGFINEYQFL